MNALVRGSRVLGFAAAATFFGGAAAFAGHKAAPSHAPPPRERNSCSLNDVIGVTFPEPYDIVTAKHDDGTGSITITCTGNRPSTTIQIDLSTGEGNSYNPRLMYGPNGATLKYNLYAGPEHRIIWGDGTPPSHARQQVIREDPVTLTIYGRIFAGQRSAEAGNYSDSLTVTVVP
jgi:spore coat protein U-like protein